MKSAFFLFFALLFVACSPQSLEEFQKEADQISEEITQELQKVSSKADLIERIYPLKRKYRKMIRLITKLDEFLQKEEEPLRERKISPAGKALYRELIRIYEIPGAKEILERIQKENILYLPKESSLTENAFRQGNPN